MSRPNFIDIPQPPSDPVTPSDMGPGTPNSGTTSLSALSTTAIKDGQHGQPYSQSRHVHSNSSNSMAFTTTLEAERADRISRLAGLERVATARTGSQQLPGTTMTTMPTMTATQPNSAVPPPASSAAVQTPAGFFDSQQSIKERSTVGSASATGSVSGRTTWASGSDGLEPDKMSESQDDEVASSVGNISDEGDTSLVGFGEGASSIVSGPTSHPGLSRMSSGSRPSSLGSPNVSRTNPFIPSYMQRASDSPMMPPSPSQTGSNSTPDQDARMVDGMTYDTDVVDTAARSPQPVNPDEGRSNDSNSGGSDSLRSRNN